jgi:hypothetical protein
MGQELTPQYVKFDPNLVGWDKGLEGAIKDAKLFGVPLAVRSYNIKEIVEEKHPGTVVIVVG